MTISQDLQFAGWVYFIAKEFSETALDINKLVPSRI